jgi:hypothetical protein
VDDEDDQTKVYCVCKQAWGTTVDERMIECDGCNEWYHPSCILMTKHEQSLISSLSSNSNDEIVWVCESCLSKYLEEIDKECENNTINGTS